MCELQYLIFEKLNKAENEKSQTNIIDKLLCPV